MRDLLPHLPIIVAVAERRSFAGAAAALGITASAASHAVKLVEQRLGQPLFARTTRSVQLTESGAQLVATLAPSLADILDALDRGRVVAGGASGHLRINAPRLAMPMALAGVIAAMARQHPGVTVEVTADEGLADIVAQGYDAGVRLGEMIAADMVAVRLTPPFRAILVASPDYLARRGRPASLAALPLHNCIGFRGVTRGGLYRWEVAAAGSDLAIETRGSAIVTDAFHALDLALAGVGIAYVFEPLAAGALAQGALEWLLPDTAITEAGLFLYFPRRAALAPKLRAFIDTARVVMNQAR